MAKSKSKAITLSTCSAPRRNPDRCAPNPNEGALDDVPSDVRDAFTFVFVQSADEVVAAVLE